jgi:outer membrane biosynthesis protein TonB
MQYAITMQATFEADKNRKAFLYTILILALILLIAFMWKWDIGHAPKEATNDFVEVNLGNLQEGFGDVQPLIKGEKSPGNEPAVQPQQTPVASNNNAAENKQEEDSKDEDATPVNKPVTTVTKPNPTPTTQPVKNTNPTPAVVNEPKPQRPKIAGYNGPKSGTGNGATEDNGYKYQGNNPTGKGDAGSPNGNPDSYGDKPGGKVAGGALRVSKGDRTIINNYIFMGDLPKATINAIIKVNPEGRGTFVSFDKGSTSTDSRYASAIRSYLPNIQFNKSDHESVVTVPFNFKVQ